MSPLREIISREDEDLWSVVGRYLDDTMYVRCCMLSKATVGLHNLKQMRARFQRAKRFNHIAFMELMRTCDPDISISLREAGEAERAHTKSNFRMNGLASSIKACLAEMNVGSMPIKVLKQFIVDAGFSHVGIIEKTDLIEKARNVQAKVGSIN